MPGNEKISSYRDRVRNEQVTLFSPVARGKSLPGVSSKRILALKIKQCQETISLLDIPCKA